MSTWVDDVAMSFTGEGTFRSACIKKFHADIAGAMATILAECDRLCNLDNMSRPGYSGRMWLQMLEKISTDRNFTGAKS